LPARGDYAVAMVFLAADPVERAAQQASLEGALVASGTEPLFWRDVPVDAHAIGAVAQSTLPCIRQLFIASGRVARSDFERALFVARKRAENAIAARGPSGFHVASMSSNRIVYKGLFVA